MSEHIGCEIGEKDQAVLDRAEISAIRAWLDARNSGRPYRMADYSPDATLRRLRWLLEYSERVREPVKRGPRRPTPWEKELEYRLARCQGELQRLQKVEDQYLAMRRRAAKSYRLARSRAGGRR